MMNVPIRYWCLWLGERHSTSMTQRAQMLESRERINMACDHLKNVEEQPARIFHSYIRQLKKKEISYPNL